MPPPTTYKPYVQRSIGEALGASRSGEESPIMNETLGVIEEHITDLSTPRQSLAPPQTIPEDSESEYSSNLERGSFLAGPESEYDDNGSFTKEEVSTWDSKQVSTHLRSLGVDSKHCDIFEDQEITGEVLLDMDQSFLQMKEFDFGVMGRRLKTWHKIRDFQLEVRGRKPSRQDSTTTGGSIDEPNRPLVRTGTGGSILPRIPSLSDRTGFPTKNSQGRDQSDLPSPLKTTSSNGFGRTSVGANTPPAAWRASMGPDSPSRPSAAATRELTHSRRHSSIDFGKQPDLQLSSGSVTTGSTHKKQSSFDQDWTGGRITPASTNITSPSTSHVIRKQESLDMSSNSTLLGEGRDFDLDRGYFSGNEVENRKARNVLRKRESTGSPAHSRQSSMLDGRTPAAVKRHSRLASVDSIRDQDGPLMSPASKAYHSSVFKGRYRSVSAKSPVLPRQSVANYSPTVTNLETENGSAAGAGATPGSSKVGMPAMARKLMGLRATSDAVTNSEKETATSPTALQGGFEESPVGTGDDGSHTPSATSQSFEVDNTDASSKGTEPQLGPMLSTKLSGQTKPKSKQQTSAYTKGLLPITPSEAREQCDHHGWMKKKASSVVGTWKPRLFILRGRRLSYYYSETDDTERGIIDISGHKVLAANSDPMLTLHATITGAKKETSSATGSAGPSQASPPTPRNVKAGTDGPFYFKLVPPKAGLSRAVQFTRPTIHYFQCDTAAEGRKWMGEIMKATIQHDLSSFETTNKQKTISLAKARARRERPPALKETLKEVDEKAAMAANDGDKADDEGEDDKENVEKPKSRESGLNIKGLNFGETDLQLPGLEPAKQKTEGGGLSAT